MSSQDQSHQWEQPAAQPEHATRPVRVLAIGLDDETTIALDELGTEIRVAPDATTCWDWLDAGDFDALMIGPGLKKRDAIELAQRVNDSEHATRPVFANPRPTVAFSVDAMRSGAVDLIRTPIQTDHARCALDRAREQADLARSQRRRVERLKKICQRLHASREDANRQVDVLCSDLASAYQEIARHMPTSEMNNSAFTQSIRSELDVEALLRMTLEHVLAKTGPTNAAVYLPTGSGDFALGAYVNYSLPSDTADVVLDHMADTLAPAFAGDDTLQTFGPNQLADRVEGVEGWIGDGATVVFACMNEGETLAVATLFRDAHEPFAQDAIDEIDSVRAEFAAQLAKVIQIHNRHKPKDTWPGFEVDDHTDDTGDDLGFGDDYGMAA